MATDFSSVFSKLRHEKGISQREAASDLGVSQALLSHYEKGVREPRLEFVARACSYYGVSADYLLGRTNVRENPCTKDFGIPKPVDGNFSVWEDQNVSCLMNVLPATLEMLFYACGRESVDKGSLYIRTAVYKLFRYIEIIGALPDEDVGTVPDCQFRALCDAAMCIAESEFASEIESTAKEGAIKKYYLDLEASMPQVYMKFINMMKQADSEINRLINRG
ncbi:MAG: helix-turn-helix domain-containing protein [Oscillospiraceae bacterium]